MVNSSIGKIYCKQGFANPYDCRRNPIIGCKCGFHSPMFWDTYAEVWRDLTKDNLENCINRDMLWIENNPVYIDGVLECWARVRVLKEKLKELDK